MLTLKNLDELLKKIKLSKGNLFITDKRINFLYLGLVVFMPEAKFVHVRRDPVLFVGKLQAIF